MRGLTASGVRGNHPATAHDRTPVRRGDGERDNFLAGSRDQTPHVAIIDLAVVFLILS